MAYENSLEALAIARQALTEQRADDALKVLQQAYLRSPDSARILSLMGVAYTMREEFIHALSCFERAAATRPSAKGYYNVAALHWLRNNAPLARTALERALKLDPGYDRARQMLAEMGPRSDDSASGHTLVVAGPVGDGPWDSPYPAGSNGLSSDSMLGNPPPAESRGFVGKVASLMVGLGRRRAERSG